MRGSRPCAVRSSLEHRRMGPWWGWWCPWGSPSHGNIWERGGASLPRPWILSSSVRDNVRCFRQALDRGKAWKAPVVLTCFQPCFFGMIKTDIQSGREQIIKVLEFLLAMSLKRLMHHALYSRPAPVSCGAVGHAIACNCGALMAENDNR